MLHLCRIKVICLDEIPGLATLSIRKLFNTNNGNNEGMSMLKCQCNNRSRKLLHDLYSLLSRKYNICSGQWLSDIVAEDQYVFEVTNHKSFTV